MEPKTPSSLQKALYPLMPAPGVTALCKFVHNYVKHWLQLCRFIPCKYVDDCANTAKGLYAREIGSVV